MKINYYKKLKNILISLLTVLFVPYAHSQELVWEENFDGKQLNEKNWNFELGDGCPNLCGWGNNEKQLYTKNNHTVKNGVLTISAKLEDSVYTSTRITTKNKVEIKYGKIEIRAKLPKGKGLWPAVWMLGSNIDSVGWPKSGEIDILEYVGKEPGKIFTSLHTQSSFGNTINTKKVTIKNIEEGFHLYTANWTKNKIEFFIDNKLVYSFTPKEKTIEIWPFNQPFYFLINMAIGGNFGGPKIDNTIFPQEFVIDYVKVYKHS